MSFVPSKYQQGLFDFAEQQTTNGVVNAVAGSGKSSSLIWTAERLATKNLSMCFLAFNKGIVDDLKPRLPESMEVLTTHSLGFRLYSASRGGRVQVDNKKEKLRYICSRMVAGRNLPKDEYFRFCALVERLTGIVMNTLTDYRNRAAVEDTINRYAIDLNSWHNELLDMLPRIMTMILDDGQVISFDEMIYRPATMDTIRIPSYDIVFVDECLPYHTPVLLDNGTSLSIGEIVDGKIGATVLAYNTETGEQEACKVIGWHKIVNQKPLVKIAVRHRIGTREYRNFVVCTVDHKIWADGRWIPAGDIQPGMIVQVETLADKVQTYKISTNGRNSLKRELIGNTRGINSASNATISENQRGGNGRPMPLAQQLLLNALGHGWESEYIFPTKKSYQEGYPRHYKIDIANPEMMVAIEVDGGSHASNRVKIADAKKSELLTDNGWLVIRIANRDAVQHTADTINRIMDQISQKADCPVDATVFSVEPVNIRDSYVYDITVEGCHDFYANGILVHNCQDMTASQIALLLKLARNGRIIAVGDPAQSIYGFRGADYEAIPRLISSLSATTLPLSICYRCPTSHLDLARRIVPQIEARENAPVGEVLSMPLDKIIADGHFIRNHTLAISRVNAPLMGAALRLIRNGIPALVKGRDIGDGLIALIRKLAGSDDPDITTFTIRLRIYQATELEKLRARDASEALVQSVEDRVECIYTISDGATTVQEVVNRVNTIFSDVNEKGAIWLSSVHRAKGLEADNVIIIAPEKLPLKVKTEWARQQETNIEYVALTRGKDKLIRAEG